MNNPLESSLNKSSILNNYRPKPGIYDEVLNAQGSVRPLWQGVIGEIAHLGLKELNDRWIKILDQMSRDGITFNPHIQDQVSRPWTLDPIPLLLQEREWKFLEAGLQQRAELLNAILADLFNHKRLLSDKVLHPDFFFGHPAVYPAYEGLYQGETNFLSLYGADLARTPEGNWFVTGDRTRAPFGLGYVLENRISTSRILPLIFRHNNVQRLAGFFAKLKEVLKLQANSENPHIALWTKGKSSRAYFEDAYLARYLGYTLAEGGDLAVRDHQVKLKTLGGLIPVDLLFRRLDDDDCDPVELDPNSMSGVSGILEICRSGKIAILNKLGSRIVESPMLLHFLPRICKYLLGQELILPTVETYWCGDPLGLAHVVANIDQMLIRPAFRMSDESPLHPALMSAEKKAELLAQLKSDPQQYVGQKLIARSSTPVCVDGDIKPWHMALRMFLTGSQAKGYQALPGGLARISPVPHELDYTMTAGERSQDVWIIAEEPVQEITLLAPEGQLIPLKRSGAELPSRVADNLFWMGRYIERAESNVRLLRVTLEKLTSESGGGAERSPLIRCLAEIGIIEPDYAVEGIESTLPPIEENLTTIIFDENNPRSLTSSISRGFKLAAQVRDRIAVDMWRTIKDIDDLSLIAAQAKKLDVVEILSILDGILAKLLSFSGLVSESMTRTLGWRFLDMGTRLERSLQSAQFMRILVVKPSIEERLTLETMLTVLDSIMTYRSRYLASIQIAPVLDLLLVDETNPRSIGFQLAKIMDHVDHLPRSETTGLRSIEQRQALSLLNMIRLTDVYELSQLDPRQQLRDNLEKSLRRIGELLPKLSDAVTNRYLIYAGLPRQFAQQNETKQ